MGAQMSRFFCPQVDLTESERLLLSSQNQGAQTVDFPRTAVRLSVQNSVQTSTPTSANRAAAKLGVFGLAVKNEDSVSISQFLWFPFNINKHLHLHHPRIVVFLGFFTKVFKMILKRNLKSFSKLR